VSLSINPSSAASCSNGPAARAAGAKTYPSGLPFDSILDDQTDASNQETDEIADADSASDRQATEANAGPGTTRTAPDRLAGLSSSSLGSRRHVPGKDAVNQDGATLSSIGKDEATNDAATLLLLAAQDVLQRIDSLRTIVPTGNTDAVPAKTPTGPAVDDQLQQNLVAALAELGAEATQAGDAASASLPAPGESSTPVSDFLIKESAQADQARGPEVPLSRPASVAPGVAFVDAIRLATGQGTFADQDKGFDQSSAGFFDRRNSKSAAPAIHAPEAVAGLDATVKAFAPLDVAAPAGLPDEKDVVSSIVQSMRLQLRDGVGTAVVHLEPDYLGAVSISLRVENGVVTASLHAENPQVRGWMEANASLLRESLSGQGLSLDRLLITDERIADERSSGRRQQQEQEQHARQRPRRDESTTFEVVV
jgi:flagellar hook-length control protein FliK